MVMAKLHMICGNCGCDHEFKYEIVLDFDDDKESHYLRVSVTCENCSTIHGLEDNAEEENK